MQQPLRGFQFKPTVMFNVHDCKDMNTTMTSKSFGSCGTLIECQSTTTGSRNVQYAVHRFLPQVQTDKRHVSQQIGVYLCRCCECVAQCVSSVQLSFAIGLLNITCFT
ncbi:hypothetical protein AVEN_55275-1 [Araneus ventricosus]|uniref:Uncharacterized protein n=1 Tax=Araneus ventricosus TaxID=182803 RepID=A0A4Y2D6U9_ARAVE|nr:hypothetical protein AVEN_55275-1 [Araneus ventricosus]